MRKILPLPGFELRPLGRPARSQSLYWLRYPGSPNLDQTTKLYIISFSPLSIRLRTKPSDPKTAEKQKWLLLTNHLNATIRSLKRNHTKSGWLISDDLACTIQKCRKNIVYLLYFQDNPDFSYGSLHIRTKRFLTSASQIDILHDMRLFHSFMSNPCFSKHCSYETFFKSKGRTWGGTSILCSNTVYIQQRIYLFSTTKF
jgi:hypothetical protein